MAARLNMTRIINMPSRFNHRFNTYQRSSLGSKSSQPSLEIFENGIFPGGGCFCLQYLLRDNFT